MYSRLRRTIAISAGALVPEFASAAPGTYKDLTTLAINIIGSLTALVIGLAFLYFFSGVIKGIQDTSTGKGPGRLKTILPWGILTFFIMFFVWGIIRLLGNSLFGTTNYNGF